jgi:hypothetical protein
MRIAVTEGGKCISGALFVYAELFFSSGGVGGGLLLSKSADRAGLSSE